MFMVVEWTSVTSLGQLAALPLFFCQRQPFDAIETEQDGEAESAKASVSVKVQSGVMRCEIAAEWALSVCVDSHRHERVGQWLNSL